uniref:hypothetical protein n=1 Tax=Acinetobacter baumannii TaxID=470 RepID=UPI003F68558F
VQGAHGTVRMLGFPIKFASAPCTVRRPAPGFGEHTAELLGELGYSATDQAVLRQRGVTR